MVLVDTSVWIRALSNREPYLTQLDALLKGQLVVGHELVYGEILVGDRGGRRRMLATYAEFPWASYVPHHDVVALVNARQLDGRGAGWIDVHLVAAALVEKVAFWTADPRLAEIAEEFGVAYHPSLH